MKFKYCPKCARKHTSAGGAKHLCRKCGYEFYFSPAPGVEVVLLNEKREILLTVRGRAPRKGTFDLPGGFIEPHESAEDAVIRELREELGLSISIKDLHYFDSGASMYRYKEVNYPTIGIGYCARISAQSKLNPADDVENAQWFSADTIPWRQLFSKRVELIVRRFFKDL